jgi:hypothetical protein
LGIAALEDKIVQQAVMTILNQIYEVDFQGFSYGFRGLVGIRSSFICAAIRSKPRTSARSAPFQCRSLAFIEAERLPSLAPYK